MASPATFVDEIHFRIQSGDGGKGGLSFRREKYVPHGGPDGGDGGKGGDVVFETRRNLATLQHLRGKNIFKASHGEAGKARRKHGKDGGDMLITVPPGTRVHHAQTGKILYDFSRDNEGERWTFLLGGQGGRGNWHFRSSRNQAPSYAQEGISGESQDLFLELAFIADIGLVGLPNAGKSSLINALTAAKSPMGAYPFTTKVPHLGVLRRSGQEVIIADIPGLIKGAAQGLGLGHRFLRHISRAVSLAYLTDLGEANPSKAIDLLEEELCDYDPKLLEKRRLIIGTKIDLEGGEKALAQLAKDYPKDRVIGLSLFPRKGLNIVLQTFLEWGSESR